MDVARDYYNEEYIKLSMELEEKSNSFEKIAPIWPDGFSGSEILDIGCGTGHISVELVTRGFSVTGVDLMHAALRRASSKGLAAVAADAQALPFGDDCFDAVLALDVIEHLFNPYLLMSEVRRVMKDDGIFILQVPNHFDIAQRISTLFGHGIIPHISRNLGNFLDPWTHPHIRFPSYKEILEMIEKTGFAVDGINYEQMKPWDFNRYNFIFQKYRVREVLAYRWPAVFAAFYKLRLKIR
ncbi:MAG: class I SAM-dependent methyltransferase [bacterium]